MAETLINQTQVSANVFTRSNLKSGSNLEFTNVTHKDNFDMVGTVTITNNIASGFSDVNYLTMQDYLLEVTSSFEVGSSFVLDSAPTEGNCSIIDKIQIASTTSFRFEVNSENKIQARFSNVAGSFTYFLTLTGTTVLSLNTHYWTKVTYSSTSGYELLLSTDGTNWVTEATSADTTLIGKTNNAKLVIGDNVTSGSSFPGSIYLTDTYINVNGSKVWTCRELVNETVISAPDVYARTNLIAGNNISIVQAQLPVIDSNTLGVWHLENDRTNAVAGSTAEIQDNGYLAYSSSIYKFGSYGGEGRMNSALNLFTSSVFSALQNFTFDLWVRTLSSGVNSSSYRSAEIGYLGQFRIYKNKIDALGPSGTTIGTASFDPETWAHIAFEKEGSTARFYINGKYKGSATTTGIPSNVSWGYPYTNPGYFYYDEIRLSNVARYQGQDFTPFTRPYSESAGDPIYQINNTYNVTSFSGYDATKTQVLKNVNGTLTWVDE